MRKKHGLTVIMGAVLGMGGLDALDTSDWKKGLIIGANYQTGLINIQTETKAKRNGMNVNANGLGFLIGYTGYFRDDQMFGARYYAFLDWQIFGAQYHPSPYGGGGYYGGNNLLTYGAAADFFYNFFQGTIYSNDISLDLGTYVGVGIAGSSWLLGDTGQDKLGIPSLGLPSVNVSAFQFLFNIGLRALLVDQHGIDLGFKIPTINNHYYTSDSYSVKLRRSFAFYINYSYHF
ncbi:outer membrane protein [Helicobacter felis]|uniref:OMP355 n=1 Tax=Helicobacter felis TaxID=214 RepID=A0A1M4NG73_HELFE|nr:outer membrane protein [Helicobacter felis]SFZ70957.1 OMP355 [Helicobacter felis ATCC 49179]